MKIFTEESQNGTESIFKTDPLADPLASDSFAFPSTTHSTTPCQTQTHPIIGFLKGQNAIEHRRPAADKPFI